MKIGILTYHRSHNYGALLQAVALRYQLVKMGHEVYFIDYWPEYHREMYALYSFKEALRQGKRGAVRYTLRAVFYRKERKQRISDFTRFIHSYIEPYCKAYSAEEEYDAVVYGSDQIWRKQSGLGNRFNPVYFADNILQAGRHVAYAASMGTVTLYPEDCHFLKQKLGHFARISVREESLQEIVGKTGFESQVVLDPTLLLSADDWKRLLPVKRLCERKYVLYYRLQEKAFDEEAIRDFAKARGCELLILDSTVRERGNDVFFTADPLEFLSLVKYADFIFTSSYHGLVFSLIFNRQFIASFVSNAGRAESILKRIGLQERLLAANGRISADYPSIDYGDINVKIQEVRQDSLKYLSRL